MRHWIGMVLAVLLAGAVFFAGAWGYRRLLRFPVQGGQLAQMPGGGGSLISDHGQLLALAAIAGTGLLAGILIAAPRISPLAAGVPGLLLLGWTGLYLVSVHRAVGLIPLKQDSFGTGFEAMLFNGLLGAAGMAMIIPMFVPSRWRARTPSYEEAEGDDGFLSMLDGAGVGDTAGGPALAGRAGRRTRARQAAVPADLPAVFHEPLDTMVQRPRPGRPGPA